MPPLPADSIHARACKLKCEKILTRPWQELVRHRHHGQRPEHLPLHHKTSPGRVDPPGPSGEIGKIPGEQRVYFELLSNKAIDAHLM